MRPINRLARHTYGVAVLSVIALLGVLASIAPSKTEAQGVPTRDVLVVNTPAEPVPTAAQGITAIAGTVGISGTPSVAIPGFVKVNIWNQNRVQKEFVEGNVTAADGEITLFTVPAGQKFVLTDAFFSHNVVDSPAVHGANVRRGTAAGSQLLFRAFVAGNDNVAFHFQTGYEFGPGQEVRYATGGSAVDGVHLSLVGYLTSLTP